MSNSIFGLVALLWLASSSAALSQISPDKLVLSARKQIGVTRSYDPAYRELARVLEPWLFFDKDRRMLRQSEENTRRWERRFLD